LKPSFSVKAFLQNTIKMKKILIFSVLIGVGWLMFFASCEYEFIDSEPESADTVQVSFQADILPIFNSNDNCTSCHKTGFTAPDLTEAHAYNSITAMGLVDLTTPKISKIYKVPGSADHAWKSYTQSQSSKVLNWISQGALNN
jgi:uncharacterized SAM-binding protein YcdF (DUF218 family)